MRMVYTLNYTLVVEKRIQELLAGSFLGSLVNRSTHFSRWLAEFPRINCDGDTNDALLTSLC